MSGIGVQDFRGSVSSFTLPLSHFLAPCCSPILSLPVSLCLFFSCSLSVCHSSLLCLFVLSPILPVTLLLSLAFYLSFSIFQYLPFWLFSPLSLSPAFSIFSSLFLWFSLFLYFFPHSLVWWGYKRMHWSYWIKCIKVSKKLTAPGKWCFEPGFRVKRNLWQILLYALSHWNPLGHVRTWCIT